VFRQRGTHTAWAIALCGIVLCIGACGGPAPDPRTDDVPTKGHVLLLADEDLRPLVGSEELVFESIYTKAELDIRYLPESELLKAMMNDSVRCVITTVLPGGDQEAYFNRRTVKAHVVPICTDAIAVVVNKARTVKRMSLVDIRTILFSQSQQGPAWASVEGGAAATEGIRAYVPEQGGGVARMLRDSLMGSDWSGSLRAQALESVEDVVARVAAEPNAIGFIPFAMISDEDDPTAKALRTQINLLPISRMDSLVHPTAMPYQVDTFPAYFPSQSTLADRSYPLRRQVIMVLAEGKSGLGTGFVSFVANHKGQRIILKLGLAPQKIPAREVEIVHE
jgi:phosphate transport system substrate-binding protein